MENQSQMEGKKMLLKQLEQLLQRDSLMVDEIPDEAMVSLNSVLKTIQDQGIDMKEVFDILLVSNITGRGRWSSRGSVESSCGTVWRGSTVFYMYGYECNVCLLFSTMFKIQQQVRKKTRIDKRTHSNISSYTS